MSTAIGFRASSTEIHWAVVETGATGISITHVDKLRPAKGDDFPNQLADFRNQVLSLFEEYGVVTAGVRTAEPVSQAKGAGVIKRNHIEGVVLATIAERGLACTFGPSATLKAAVGGSRGMKAYVEGDDFQEIEGWADLGKERKEAVYAAVASLRDAE